MWHVIRWYGCPWARMTEAPFLEQLPRGTPTIAAELQRAGYATGIVGKWHLTNGQDGDYRGLRNEYSHHYGFDYAGPLLEDHEFKEGSDRGAATLTQQALGFIERNRESPWFCFLSHHMIHGKVVAPESLTKKFRSQGFGDEGPNRAVYLAGLKVIDNSVGKLLQGLKELGEEHETVVIFLSDNGGIFERLEHRSLKQPHPDAPTLEPNLVEYSNAPLRDGKGSIYEGGVRVPFLVKWPGVVSPQTVVHTPIHAIDLAPTFFSMAGHTPSEELKLDGVDLSELVQGKDNKASLNRPIFQYSPFYDLNWGLTPCASIRKGKYKLIEFFGDRFTRDHRYLPSAAIELYDLESDISENRNLAQKSPQVVAELQAELHSWMADLQVVASKPNPHHEPARAFETTSTKPDWMGKQ